MCVICLFRLTFSSPSSGNSRPSTQEASVRVAMKASQKPLPSMGGQAQTHRLHHPFILCLVISHASHVFCRGEGSQGQM